MAKIVAEISNIPGESTVTGYVGHLDAVAIRETLEIPASASDAIDNAKHSDVMLIRVRDKGSPKLAQACSGGTLLGDVTIRLYRGASGSPTVYMTYVLKEAYVSRYEYDTADENGLAYMPHFGPTGHPMAQSVYGVASLVPPPDPSKVRISPRSLLTQQRGVAGNRDVERVWFNSKKVEWSYVGGGGTVEAKWDIAGETTY